MKQQIYLRRSRKIILQKGNSQLANIYPATLQINIENLGFTPSEALKERIKTLYLPEVKTFYNQLVSDIKTVWFLNYVKYEPMYPNFPEQVMSMSHYRLYQNALIHYVGDLLGVRLLPQYDHVKREPLKDNKKLKVIDLGSTEDFEALFTKLAAAKTSLSDIDKKDLTWFIETYGDDIQRLMPEEITFKENLVIVAAALLKHTSFGLSFVKEHFKTATDLLRLATAMSNGDVSLAGNTKFRNFKRKERRQLLTILEQCENITEDVFRHKNKWLRLGERLHPFEYKKQFPKVYKVFDKIRNQKKPLFFNGKIEQGLLERNTTKVVDLLQHRPGEFARRLDHLLRLNLEYQTVILQTFSQIIEQVSSPLLVHLLKHFKERNSEASILKIQETILKTQEIAKEKTTKKEHPNEIALKYLLHGAQQPKRNVEGKKKKGKLFDTKNVRVFFPKGDVGKTYALEGKLPPILEESRLFLVALIEKELIQRFNQLEPLGKVYLEDALKNFIVPFSQRSASKALRTIVRGSKLDIPEGDTIRFFLWWKEGMVNGKSTGRVDIDLSAVMYDENWCYQEHISYTNLKSSKYQACHSGDITSAPNGACEFIDLHIPSILEYGGRYVVMSLNSFTSQPYCNLPECYGGWMIRQHPQSGEIFEPQTVEDSLDVSANTQICIPVILDLKERKIIWTDLGLTTSPKWGANNVETNMQGMSLTGIAMTSIVKPTLYELFELHTKARGTLVENREEAATIFSVKEGITPFDIETIMADFL